MPTDVFLMLCSSGLALVASLMYFVSDDRPPRGEDDPRLWIGYVLPPARTPPPLPRREQPDCTVELSTGGLCCTMRLVCHGEEWTITLDTQPRTDSPALALWEDERATLRTHGAAHDLRWHGRAGVAKPTRSSWRKPPARA